MNESDWLEVPAAYLLAKSRLPSQFGNGTAPKTIQKIADAMDNPITYPTRPPKVRQIKADREEDFNKLLNLGYRPIRKQNEHWESISDNSNNRLIID